MDRCPNCGATVRAGAKFCTTCGMRLPESAAAASTPETASRSPFDSTSTVASRWPSRSIYGTTELPPSETSATAENGAVADEPNGPADQDATDAASEPTTTSTWGGWTAPSDTNAQAVDDVVNAPTSWGNDTATTAEPEVSTGADATESESSEWGTRTGETDFLSLPEQPDPAAWASIESELKGEAGTVAGDQAPSAEAAPIAEEQATAEAVTPQQEAGAAPDGADVVVDETATEVVAEPEAGTALAELAPSTMPVDRANELLDELRGVIAGLSASPAPVEAPPVATRSYDDVKPSAEEIARFTELRTAVETASAKPRDIDSMLDISGRLDAIKELHDAFNRLNDAVFNTDEAGTDE